MKKHALKGRLILIILVILIVVPGCATIDSIKPGAGSKFEVSGKSYQEIWNATIKSVTKSLTIVESNKELGYVKAEKGAGMATWGEIVGVFITPSEPGHDHYQIEVVSLKRVQVQLTGQDWTLTIIEGIKAELNI